MTREYTERMENFEKYCEEIPDQGPCVGPYSERKAAIDRFRETFASAGPEIFTASIRTGIVFLLCTIDEACVSEIQYALNEPRQPLISQHLRKMKKAGWLKDERQGRWTCYSLRDEKRESMKDLFEILSEGK
ncbi:MAG: ArsR/SmtB family transcription factor [Candidatus Thorarchaeota archaeon]